MEEQRIKRKKKKRKKKSPLIRLIVLLSMIAIVICCLKLPVFDIKSIEVTGNEVIKDSQIRKESTVKKGDNFFQIRKKSIENALLENPYFESVKINKDIPDTVKIQVVERVPCAILPYGDKYVVLDEGGIVLGLKKSNPKLTTIMGITIKNMDSGQVVVPKQQEVFDKSLDFIKLAEENDLFFKIVHVEGKRIQCNVYDNIYVEGRYDQVVKQMKNGNLKAILEDLYKKEIKRGTVIVNGEKYCSFTPTFD